MINHKDTTDGPIAFPIDRPGYTTLGMTLRDYFAVAALNGIITHPIGIIDADGNRLSIAQHGITAYEYADAMLAARENP